LLIKNQSVCMSLGDGISHNIFYFHFSQNPDFCIHMNLERESMINPIIAYEVVCLCVYAKVRERERMRILVIMNK